MSEKLIVVNAIHGRDKSGGPKVYGPGEEYTPVNEEERNYLLFTGAARPASGNPVGVEVEVTEDSEALEALLSDLNINDIREGLDFLEVEYDLKGKKPELLEAFRQAAQANPIKFSEFVDKLTA